MERITTKTSLFGVVLAMVAVLLASLSARGQYESFFGGESWEYTNGFHPVTKARPITTHLCLRVGQTPIVLPVRTQ